MAEVLQASGPQDGLATAAALPEAEKGYQTLTSSNPMVGLPPPSPFTALCQTASAMPHLADVRRSDQSVQEESIRIKQDELLDAMTAPVEAASVGDAPRRSSHSPEDTAPAPQDGAADGTERNGHLPQASMARLQSDPDLSEAATPIKIITTLAEEEKSAAKASDKAPADGDGPKDDANLSPSRRGFKPSEADEAAALALQAIFVAPPDISRTHSPLQILTAEVEKEKEEEEERAATDTPLADGETLPRAFEVCFDSVADAAQVALLLASDGVLSHEDLCVFIKHWGRLRGAQESYAVGKNWKRSLRNLMKKIPTFVSPSEDTWTLANPSAPPPPLFADTRRLSVSLASLRRIFPPISATPAPPRPTAITSQPRPKRQSTDMPTMPSKKERDAEHANGKAEEDDVDVVIAHDIVKMKEEAAEPEQKSTPNRSRGRVTKAEMRELFENVSSPLGKANVRAIVNEKTYATLSADERANLEKLLPPTDRNPDALVGILRGRNAFFNDSIVMYQNMLKSGAFDPYFADQRSMMRERRARERDPWKAANFEEHWGEQLLKKLWDSRNNGEPAESAVVLPPPAAVSTPVPAAASDETFGGSDKKRNHRKKEARPRPAPAELSAPPTAEAGQGEEEDKEKWLACDQCSTWIIAAADGIADISPYDETLTPNPLRYLCPLCRGEDRERPAKRAARKEVSGSLSSSGSKRSRDEASSVSDHHPPARVARARNGEDEEEIELRS